MGKTDIAIIGMAVMGKNLALNFSSHNYQVSIYNRTTQVAENVIKEHPDAKFTLAKTLEELVGQLKKPRKIIFMIKAGKPVDDMIKQITPLLEDGDILIDGGNSYFKDTQRRYEELKEKSIGYVGLGVSGGETGARLGPALMPGADKKVYEEVKTMLNDIAAKAKDSTPCAAYLGTGGAGHFVKMVHNGIEYAEMQIISEIYDLLHNLFNYTNEEISKMFERWNQEGPLQSYLVEITSRILQVKDPRDEKTQLIDKVLDIANQKGTGKWTSLEAVDLGVDCSILTSALNARYISMLKDQREKAEEIYDEEIDSIQSDEEKMDERTLEAICYDAMLAGKILIYAQGFSLYQKASKEYGWDLKYDTIASSFRAGCIIRSALLENIMQAYSENQELENLIFDKEFSKILSDTVQGLRMFNTMAVLDHIAIPSLSAALTYFDSITRKNSPANIIQAQRDYFGAHTYQRTDCQGVYHMNWEEVSDVKNADKKIGKEVQK